MRARKGKTGKRNGGAKMFFCYARVSTDEQDARSQMAGIREMLAKGWSAGRIAKKLHVHPQTLRMHIRNNGLTVNKGDTEK